jgi:phage portal protein BeeE
MLPKLKQWFSALAGKSATPGASAWLRGQDMTGPQERLAEPFRKSAWVRSAIKHISGPISSVPVEFFAPGGSVMRRGRRRAGGSEEVQLPAMQQWLRSPMKGYSLPDFVDLTVTWLKLAGEFFWVVPPQGSGFYAENKTWQVIMVRPDRMRHVVDNGVLMGWEYTDGAGKRYALLPEEVIHRKNANPYDEWRGLGDYEAAALATEADYLAGRFAKNLMANNGDTGPYVVVKSGVVSPEQREQMYADLRSKRAAQLRGEFKPVVLGGDISVEDPQIRSVDPAYLQGRIENRHEVYAAFGVPPSLADVKAAYSIGSASDQFQLIFNTCIPVGNKICSAVDQVAERMTGQLVESALCWEEHPTMQEVRKERLASVDALWSKGVPMSVIDEYLNLGLPDYEGKETPYLPFSVAPVGGGLSEDLTQNPELAENPVEDPEDVVAQAIRGLRRKTGGALGKHTVCGCSIDERDLQVTGRDAKDVAQWKSLVSKRLPVIKAFRTKLDKLLMDARRQVLSKLETKSPSGASRTCQVTTRAVAADFLFNLTDFKAQFRALMRGASLDAVTKAGNQFYQEIGRDDPWKAPSADTINFISGRENKLAGVPDEIFEGVKAAIQEQIEKGGTMDEIAAAVKAEFNKVSDRRCRTIAQTETGAAYGFARQKSMESAGIQWKRWLVSGNKNVRAAHQMMNGAVVGIDESFMVINPDTGESDYVKGPGDPDGAPWNVINCHCVAVAEANAPDNQAEPAE